MQNILIAVQDIDSKLTCIIDTSGSGSGLNIDTSKLAYINKVNSFQCEQKLVSKTDSVDLNLTDTVYTGAQVENAFFHTSNPVMTNVTNIIIADTLLKSTSAVFITIINDNTSITADNIQLADNQLIITFNPSFSMNGTNVFHLKLVIFN